MQDLSFITASKAENDYSVSQLLGAISIVIADNFSSVRVRGEITDCKLSAAGHVFFKLKEGEDSINCVCFANIFKKMQIALQDGMMVKVFGKINCYKSENRLVIFDIKYNGLGEIMLLVEQRKAKLASLGLFDMAKKKKIPPSYAIERIGLITSSVGAVFHDIINRIEARYPKKVILYPTAVQGKDAAEQVINGIDFFNNHISLKDVPQVIIIARGGGSMEDLFCFNDEELAFAISSSSIPIISAIGHETDYTIADFVADLRAPTPTAAGEIVTSPTMDDIVLMLQKMNAEIHQNILKNTDLFSGKLVYAGKILQGFVGQCLMQKTVIAKLSSAIRRGLESHIQRKVDMARNFSKFFESEVRGVINSHYNENTVKISNMRARFNFSILDFMAKKEFQISLLCGIWDRSSLAIMARIFNKNQDLILILRQKLIFFTEELNRANKLKNARLFVSERLSSFDAAVNKLNFELKTKTINSLSDMQIRLNSLKEQMRVTLIGFLSCGYAKITDDGGAVLTSAKVVQPESIVRVLMSDGTLIARIIRVEI